MSSHKYPASVAGGAGDVVGPISSGDESIARFSGVTGKILQDSLATLDDTGNIVTPGEITLGAQALTVSDLNIVQSTGLAEGGIVTINADPTKFDVSAGKGRVLDYYTDPDNPTWVPVTWTAFTAVTVTNIGTQEKTWVLVDSAGLLIQQNIYPTPQDRRLYIVVGVLNHIDNVNINDVISNPDYLGAPLSQLNDLVRVMGPFNAGGNLISPNGANLSIDKSAGEFFGAGINYDNAVNNPNLLASAALSPVTFAQLTETDITNAATTFIDPLNYDVGGVVTAIPGGSNTATIQRVFASKVGYFIAYGQNTYGNVDVARLNIPSDSFVGNDSLAGISVLLAYICVSRTATDLSILTQAEIVLAGRFSGTSSVVSGDDTLQSVYDNSTNAHTNLSSLLGGMGIRDNVVPIGGDLFELSDSTDAARYFRVDVNGFGGDGISASKALISDANSRVKDSSVTSTELGYVSGATSVIQTQINNTKATNGNVAISSDVTLTDRKDHLVDTTAARALELPPVSITLFLRLKDISGSAQTNNITITTPGAETIDGSATFVIESSYASFAIISDGVNYFVI